MVGEKVTLAEITVMNPAASRVFYRHGLDFCCHGNQPLAAACEERGLLASSVLKEIENETRIVVEPVRWQDRPDSELIFHIVNYYHGRLRAVFPHLIEMAGKVEHVHRDKASRPRGLAEHLRSMHMAVLDHLAKEENVLFPMILAGRGAFASGPIHTMEIEHEDHGENLKQIRRITQDFRAPAEACPTWRALYAQLAELEAELMEHIHLENNILFRRALLSRS